MFLIGRSPVQTQVTATAPEKLLSGQHTRPPDSGCIMQLHVTVSVCLEQDIIIYVQKICCLNKGLKLQNIKDTTSL